MRKGTQVSWKYGTGTATGKIESAHKEPISRTIKGSVIHRNGSADDPAFVIVQENGDRVLKLKSEVKAASTKKPAGISQRVFLLS
ncbi:hypervirulence associated TUDOR domain-containing protein [Hymenobacter siberiensis]|uniref:DUF2945 domain-containing protein n=2 Tax=Hymenobacter siberiensis TaxID=2848396 RepID=UPI001C1E3A04|nr:DUF2945 domain-containing protein [Hymenobacter siberiensis]